MRHARSDYDTIQPWPTKRRHVVKVDGEPVDIGGYDTPACSQSSSTSAEGGGAKVAMGNHWNDDGDLVIEDKTLFRQVGWKGASGRFYDVASPPHSGQPHPEPSYAPIWRQLGCKQVRRLSDGKAAWKLRAPRRSREDWLIEVKHSPYLGRQPYTYGEDAWRISIQVERDNRWTEIGYLVATSESEALASVEWLDALAGEEDRGNVRFPNEH